MDIIDLDNRFRKNIGDIVFDCKNGVSILTGSGISIFKPSSIPSGWDIANSLFETIFRKSLYKNHDTYFLKKLFLKIPFEVINGFCPNKPILRELIINLCNGPNSNKIHLGLLRFCIDKNCSLITPNYDLGFDQIISSKSLSSIKTIISKPEFDSIHSFDPPIYFKIHGSVGRNYENEIVYELSQEGRLLDWKNLLLHGLLKDRVLLIIGYSGSDFDICPEIIQAKPERIFWNILNLDLQNLPANLKLISENIDTSFIKGDMRLLLSELLNSQEFLYLEERDNYFQDKFDVFTEDEISEWGLSILQNLSYSRILIPRIKELLSSYGNSECKSKYLSKLGEAYASNGKYLLSARSHEAASKMSNDTELFFKYDQLLAAADSWRSYGSIVKAIRNLTISKLNSSKLESYNQKFMDKCDRIEILILGNLYQFFTRISCSYIFAFLIEKRAFILITRICESFLSYGQHIHLNQILLWCHKFDINKEWIEKKLKYSFPSESEKYIQINFPMGKMMSTRENLKKRQSLLKDLSFQSQIKSYILEAKKLGIFPEVWKLSLILIHTNNNESYKYWRFFFKYFFLCEYSLHNRILQLLKGD